MITLERRSERFKQLQQRMFDVQDAKGRDYGEDHDGLRNLRRRGQSGVVARMGDKLSRLESLIGKRDPSVKDEPIEDTLIDLANYCLLLVILREDEAGMYL